MSDKLHANVTNNVNNKINPAAPMPAAPIVYNTDGSVAWDQMWDTFCVLASAGGPPHRSNLLQPPTEDDPTAPAYHRAGEEIRRGIKLVSGLDAAHDRTGWLAIQCDNAVQARWISDEIVQENVQSFAEGNRFFVPVASTFTTTNEIKNVITVVAKTAHYWQDHIQNELKTIMAWEARIVGAWRAWRKPKQK